MPPAEGANKTPLPPAMAGTIVGQPPRKRLKLDDDPFGAVGDYAGSFLIKSAVELSGGYDTNPGRTFEPHGLPSYVIAPEFLAVSDWERHALAADLRGSFTGYRGDLPAHSTACPIRAERRRPADLAGHIDGRLDVARDTVSTAQARLRVSNRQSRRPDVQAALARYPIYGRSAALLASTRGFVGLDVTVGATVDRRYPLETLQRQHGLGRRPQF